MNLISPTEIIRKLEKGGGRIKEIGFLLFSFILLRNILEGILEEGHLFGLHPYPYRSFLINFIHFPLFYINVFLILVLIFAIFSHKVWTSREEEFSKIAGSISQMFWIILLPPIIDFLVSKGRGYDLSYILQGENILGLIVSSFNPIVSLPGITIGMRIEIYLAMVFCFIWILLKRKKLFWAVVGVLCIYLSFLFLGLLPLVIAKIFGHNFSSFYSSGGILFYDTQKLAAILFILFFILFTIAIALYFKNIFKEIYYIRPINVFMLITLIIGFILGLKTFLTIKPNFIITQDYLACAVLILSGFMALRIDINRSQIYAVIIGLIAMLIISYYPFLALLVVVILAKLSERYGKIFKIVFRAAAFFFTFLAGLAVFTNERAFSALTLKSSKEFYSVKSEWIEEETLIKRIERNIRNQKWQNLENIFSANPYFISPPAVIYLEGIYNMCIRNFQRAERYVRGAITLGYDTENVYLTLGDIYFRLDKFHDAIEMYKDLLTRDLKDIRVYKGLASCFFQKGDFDNSIIYYKKAIESNGQENPHLFNNLGVAYLKNGEYELARISFIGALILNSNLEEARKNLSIVESYIKNSN